MAQAVPFNAYLGASKTGQAIGATIYQLDGTTVHSATQRGNAYMQTPTGGVSRGVIL